MDARKAVAARARRAKRRRVVALAVLVASIVALASFALSGYRARATPSQRTRDDDIDIDDAARSRSRPSPPTPPFARRRREEEEPRAPKKKKKKKATTATPPPRAPRVVVDARDYPDAVALATLVRDEVSPSPSIARGSLVVLTFADRKMLPLAINFVTHLSELAEDGVPHVVGALDATSRAALSASRAKCGFVYTPDAFGEGSGSSSSLDGSSSHSSGNWKAFARVRIGEARALLSMGFDVLMSDVDVVWRRDPRPFFSRRRDDDGDDGDGGDDGDYDASLASADVMVSSDNLSPRRDFEQGATYAARGTFNTGIVFARRTPAGERFAAAWYERLARPTGRFASLTSDQQVFNAMVRAEGRWPGIEPARALIAEGGGGIGGAPRVLNASLGGGGGADGDGDASSFRLGVLPVRLFTPGHVTFVQRVHESSIGGRPVRPYAVHATYTFDGSTAAAKRMRFAEVGLWSPNADRLRTTLTLAESGDGDGDGDGDGGDATAPLAGGDAEEKFLTFDPAPSTRDVPRDDASIGAHLAAAANQLAALRDASAIARVLNRTLAIPAMRCHCDKVWGGHDNIFAHRCRYPGSEDGDHVPGRCPMDHLVSPSALRDAGIRFVAEAELRRIPSVASRVDAPGGEVEVIVADDDADAVRAGMSDSIASLVAVLPAGADAATTTRVLGSGGGGGGGDAASAASRATLLRLSTVRGGTFGGFNDAAEAAAFNAKVTRGALGRDTPEWCGECHPNGCAALIPAEVLKLGITKPTRVVHDMFCARFETPADVPVATRAAGG